MPLDWREPLSSAAYLPASGCMIAAPRPPITTSSDKSHNDPASEANEIDTTTINTPVGINHQRPCRSV